MTMQNESTYFEGIKRSRDNRTTFGAMLMNLYGMPNRKNIHNVKINLISLNVHNNLPFGTRTQQAFLSGMA